jgi:hypothetical protein
MGVATVKSDSLMSMRWRKVMFNGLTGRNQRSTGVYVPTLFAVIRNDVVKNDSHALIQA